MRKGVKAAVIGAVVGLGGVAAAQAPMLTVHVDRLQAQGQLEPGRGLRKQLNIIPGKDVVYAYNAMFPVNAGATLRADRAVMNGGEVTLEGNVRLTMPQSK
jgi:hypothetical protein